MKIDYFHKNPKMIKVAVVVIGLVVVVMPVKNTVALFFKYTDLNSSVQMYRHTTNNVSKEKLNDKLLANTDHERRIFEEVSRACQEYKVVIKQVDLPKTTRESGIIAQTQEILLEGDYINILRSLESVSLVLDPVKIASVKFEREENNKKIILVAHVIFQSVKLEDNEGEG